MTNLQNTLIRNIGALLVTYYATFSSTISKPKGKEVPRGGERGRQLKNEAISEGVGMAFRGVFRRFWVRLVSY